MLRIASGAALAAALSIAPSVIGQNEPRRSVDVEPNFMQARQYSSSYLRQRTYSTSVRPNWIGKTDRFWYSYRTSAGTRYYLVDPKAGAKQELFDHAGLAAHLSAELGRPLEAHALSLGSGKVEDEGKTFSFVAGSTKFSLDLASGALTNQGKARAASGDRQSSTRGSRRRSSRSATGSDDKKKSDPRAHRSFSPDRTAYVFLSGHDLYYVEASDAVKAKVREIDARMKKEAAEKKAAEAKAAKEKADGEKTETVGSKEGDGKKLDSGKEKETTGKTETKSGEKKTENQTNKQATKKGADPSKDAKEEKVDERERWADDVDESKAVRLTDDGEEDYEFSKSSGSRRGPDEDVDESVFDEDEYLEKLQSGEAWASPEERSAFFDDDEEDDEKTEKARPRVSWAPDSSAFYITRRDTRGVEQLFLVNSLSQPRPTLETYDYPLPGEKNIRRSELFVFDREGAKLTKIEAKWKDEAYQSLRWRAAKAAPKPTEKAGEKAGEEQSDEEKDVTDTGDELRFLRRDRLLRNVEYVSMNTRTGELQSLVEEGFVAANIAPQSPRYIRDNQQMIWWSERSGWGHYYLYDRNGTLLNPITAGAFRASSIVEVDEEKGLLYFLGNGREKGENVYYQHLYRVFLDGTGLTLMDPGDANHRSTLSPTRSYVVDNCSRIDMAPVSRLCDADGKEVMRLEETDLSRLYESGWQMPERFTFKAADGITELYGNMWKPFDFDPKKKYPIIAEVYPGPQTEGVSHGFSSSNGRQQLAQIGFIVVQLGHRGGTPGRSKAYHSYGYNNLRDYGLADKKAGIEQLAARHSFIDIERVGLYGHSGGGFMTAAAMMREPYNDFFKVGVSSSGNHDNNVYGYYWAERYHGLKQVEVEKKTKSQAAKSEGSTGGDGKKSSATKGGGVASDGKKAVDASAKNQDGKKQDEKKKVAEKETRFEIQVPTNAELAPNLKGHLLLVHGDMDNNVHPAGTMRLVDALIKANKRFDLLIIPGKRHGYGDYNGYFTQRKWEYFAQHLLGYRPNGVDINQKR